MSPPRAPLQHLGAKEELTLQLHMPSTLAVGDPMAWGRGQLMQDPKEVGKRLICVDDVSTYLAAKSAERCRVQGKCGKLYDSCFTTGC